MPDSLWIIFAIIPFAALLGFYAGRDLHRAYELRRWHNHIRRLPTSTVKKVLRQNSGER